MSRSPCINDGNRDQWLEGGLEYLGRCPVCGSETRTVLHDDLQDKVFFCAPGIWTMWRCSSCRSGYIDPRPSVETIGMAYGTYYTHSTSDSGSRTKQRFPKSLIENLRKRGRPAYFNTRYGYRFEPALGPFNVLTRLLPDKFTLPWDDYIRHLPAPNPGGWLLDVGCGNGNFLKVATDLGYTVTGLEIDPSAVEAARSAGFEVKVGALPETGLAPETFDHITLNHVLEHLHDPLEGMHELYRLLKPGGRLWMQYPNIDSCGHEIYGPAWRGLEPPRHLVMPSLYGARLMLDAAGFTNVNLLKSIEGVEGYFSQSDKIRSYMDAAMASKGRVSEDVREEAELTERREPEKREHLTLIAFKAAKV